MISKLYKIALWYIEKCNRKWHKCDCLKLSVVDRLTYKNGDKYYLKYGVDSEWSKFSRYNVLDNAIQKLAKYENKDYEI